MGEHPARRPPPSAPLPRIPPPPHTRPGHPSRLSINGLLRRPTSSSTTSPPHRPPRHPSRPQSVASASPTSSPSPPPSQHHRASASVADGLALNLRLASGIGAPSKPLPSIPASPVSSDPDPHPPSPSSSRERQTGDEVITPSLSTYRYYGLLSDDGHTAVMSPGSGPDAKAEGLARDDSFEWRHNIRPDTSITRSASSLHLVSSPASDAETMGRFLGRSPSRPALRSRRSAASLHSIHEERRLSTTPPPPLPSTAPLAPLPRSSTSSRRPSIRGAAVADDPLPRGFASPAGGSSARHSLNSQYASSSSNWTPSSLWGSQFDGGNPGGGPGERTRGSMASSDFTADTDYEGSCYQPKTGAMSPQLPASATAATTTTPSLTASSVGTSDDATQLGTAAHPPSVLPHSIRKPRNVGLGLVAADVGPSGDEASSERVRTSKSSPASSFSAIPWGSSSRASPPPAAEHVSAVGGRRGDGSNEEEEEEEGIRIAGEALDGWDTGSSFRGRLHVDGLGESLGEQGRAVTTAEEGKSRIVDWSAMSCALEEVDIPSDTTHLILPDTSSPFVLDRLLRDRLAFVASNLLVLDISFAKLTSLPREIAACASLEELDVSGNQLEGCILPPWLSKLTSLRVLAADECDLFDLPHSLAPLGESLRDLSLRYNHLSFLPLWLCHLPKLEVLLVDGNEFTQPWKGLVEPLLQHGGSESSNAATSFGDFTNPPTPAMQSRRAPGYAPSVAASSVSSLAATRPPLLPHSGASSALRPHFEPQQPSRASSRRGSVSGGGGAPVASAPMLRKMRSAGDVAFAGSVRKRTASNMGGIGRGPPPPPPPPRSETIESYSLVDAAVASEGAPIPVSEAAESVTGTVRGKRASEAASNEGGKKPLGFFKKMSFGKLLKEPRSRTVSSEATLPFPASIEENGIPPPSSESVAAGGRSGSQSPATLLSPTPSTFDRNLRKRRSFLQLDQAWASPSPSPMTSAAASVDDFGMAAKAHLASHPYAAAAAPMASRVDARNGLRSIIMYLRDVNDLTNGSPLPRSGATPSSRKGSASSGAGPRAINSQSFIDIDPADASQASEALGADLSVKPAPPAKIADNPERRRKVLEEIVATERSYIKGLQELQEIYIGPATAMHSTALGKDKEPVVPIVERKRVFSNVEAIFDFHVNTLLPHIEKALAGLSDLEDGPSEEPRTRPRREEGELLTSAAEQLSQVFIRNAAFLKLYATYITQFDSALDRLREWTAPPTTVGTPPLSASGATSPALSMVGGSAAMVGSPSLLGSSPSFIGKSGAAASGLSSGQRKRLGGYLKRCRQHPSHSQINLESYLLLPVQRLPRYRLLLETLLGCTPDREAGVPGEGQAVENKEVAQALKVIATITADMNERKRDSEGRQRLLYWQQRLGNRFKSPLVQPHRTLEREGGMTLVRTVRLSAHGAGSGRFRSLVADSESMPVIALLCTDLVVLCKDPGDGANAPVTTPIQLHQALRIPNQASAGARLPASVFGSDGSMIRYVDPRMIVYLRCSSARAALEWQTAINARVAGHSASSASST